MTESTAESFGNIPNASANFGTFPQSAEEFRTMRNNAERTEQHTLTVREVARLFEQAGVPRTERSIINWCQPNRQGIARLDAFFDTNERKYFITPQSVSLAVQEESAKKPPAGGHSETQPPSRAAAEEMKRASEDDDREGGNIRDLRREVTDLKITNQVKEQFIEVLQKDRERLFGERENYVRELMAHSRRIGELETQVLQLGDGGSRGEGRIPKDAESAKVRNEFMRHDATLDVFHSTS